MDWQKAIAINCAALQRVLAAIAALAGLAPDAKTITLPRAVRLEILRVVRPAESALRRLIVIAARGIKPSLQNRPAPDFSRLPQHKNRPASFALFDRRKRFAEKRASEMPLKGVPRLTFTATTAALPALSYPRKAPDDTRLMQRIRALQEALADMPKQARRLARHQVRRATLPAGPRRVGPLRPGFPPAHKKRPTHEIDFILRECHALAVQARALPPTFQGGGISNRHDWTVSQLPEGNYPFLQAFRRDFVSFPLD